MTLKNNGENNPNLQYSIDGASWSTYDTTINIGRDQTLYLKGDNPDGWSHSITKHSNFTITGDVYLSGNVMGLIDNGTNTKFYIPCSYCFYDLFFESTGITSISKNFLPATNLTSYCYGQMFYGCSSLATAPELSATTLANNCYECMFQNCSSLATAPELPATSLVSGCYGQIFDGCSSLNSIKIGYIGDYDYQYFYHWVDGIAGSGTFYYNGDQTVQDFQLPSGWAKKHIN